jgi:uncharacterized protein (DUF1697 family)
MTRYVALLRAVNLGSTNKVGMKWLREAAGDAGFTDVATYVQSGNVVLTSSGSADEVSDTVARLIKAEYGLDIDVIVRDRKQIAAVVKANPFGDLIEEPTRVHVNFLSAAPPKSKLAALDPDQFPREIRRQGQRDVPLLPRWRRAVEARDGAVGEAPRRDRHQPQLANRHHPARDARCGGWLTGPRCDAA